MTTEIARLRYCGQVLTLALLLAGSVTLASAQSEPSAAQLEKWRLRFPEADANKDGQLTAEEAQLYQRKIRDNRKSGSGGGSLQGGAPRQFEVDPGWDAERFPDHAVSYLSPEKIREIYEQSPGRQGPVVASFEKPESGALRIVGTGHSFMQPGYKTLAQICRGAGFEQPLHTHIGGGITGSARYKWEQENGIFQFDGKPTPKLLASIANADWEVMMWGPYFHDRPEYYRCWIDFALKYHPEMCFYLSDAWPQLYQLGELPGSEAELTAEVWDRLAQEKRNQYGHLVDLLREEYPGKVYILPTSDAMWLAAKAFLRGDLPGVEGLHKRIGGKERSLWRDELGHLGPGFERLEGYVFYATLYGQSPEKIGGQIDFGGPGNYPGDALDAQFRKIAWQAVTGNPLSGITDADGDGIGERPKP